MTFIVMAGAAIAGAGLGVHLGRAAIGEINPICYSEPPSGRFFADLTPNPYALAVADQPADPWTQEVDAAGGQRCFDCAANLVDPIYAAPGAMPADTPAPAEVVRYASFPVSREETPGIASPGTDQPEPAGM